MFENSLRLVGDCGLTHLHVFPYSPRPGTPAARMPAVDRAVIKERALRLREAGDRALAAHLAAEVGSYRPGLIEKSGLGRTEHFTLTELPKSLHAAAGDIVATRIVGHTTRALLAEAA